MAVTVELTMTAEEDAGGEPSTVHIVECEPPVGPGWHWYLDRLAASLAGTPMPDWDDYYPALTSAYG